MTIIVIEGTIVAPTMPNAYGVSGYDNAGLFGPQFANLGGDRFTITWTLGPPFPYNTPAFGFDGPMLDAALTINGITWDMGAVPAGDQILSHGQWNSSPYGMERLGFDATLSTIPGAFTGSIGLAIYDIQFNPLRADLDKGQASLAVYGHPYKTVVDFAVPSPELGTGWAVLALLPLLWVCSKWRKR